MRRSSQNATRAAERAGNQIAAELHEVFAAAHAGITTGKLLERQAALSISRLRKTLYDAVAGFNDAAPWDFQLAVITRGDRLIFNSCGQFTLTVALGERQVMLCPNRDTMEAAASIPFEILRDGSALQFRTRAAGARTEPLLTEREFLHCVLRMACHKDLRQLAPC